MKKILLFLVFALYSCSIFAQTKAERDAYLVDTSTMLPKRDTAAFANGIRSSAPSYFTLDAGTLTNKTATTTNIDGTSNLFLGAASTTTIIGNSIAGLSTITMRSTLATVFQTAGLTRMYLAANGNLGLGTTFPSSLLHVAGTTTTPVLASHSIDDFLEIKVKNLSTGIKAQSGFTAEANNGTDTSGFAWMGINNSGFNFPAPYNIGGANDVTYIGRGNNMYIANANTSSDIIIATGKAASPFFDNRIVVKNSGNVGINTSTPTTNFYVNGSIGTNVVRLQTSTTAYVITSTNNRIHLWGTLGQQITLPAAAAWAGRELNITNHASLAATTSIAYRTTAIATTTNIAAGANLCLVSDGTEWYSAN